MPPSEPRASGGLSALAALAVLAGAGAVVVTCGQRGPEAPPAASSVALPAPPPPSSPAPLASAAPVPPPPPEPKGPLATLKRALEGLEKKTRSQPVRLVWLGDSHGQADFWPGALRDALGKRFGDAGPGHVHLGYRKYRHDGVKLKADGNWLLRPKGPSTSVVTDDGIFGLGGMLLKGGAGNAAAIEVSDDDVKGPITFDLCWRGRSAGDELEVRLGGEKRVLKSPGTSALSHEVLSSDDPRARLKVLLTRGAPELCGVVIETKGPGVVVDNLGINGARVSTALAWEEASWKRELQRREPSLVILEYGTNESSDHHPKAERYAKNVEKLMARVRDAAPKVSCVVLAPTERKDVPERTPVVRDGMMLGAEQAGCLFWDTYEKMGGRGGMERWMAGPDPRAAKDGVHLSTRGYRQLGQELAKDLLAAMELSAP